MNQGDGHNALASIPMKRSRGRPRKYPISHSVQNTQPRRDPNLSRWKKVSLQEKQTINHGENISVPPGFETSNGNQPWQGNLVPGANDIMVGQVVSGVVEAVFDAGCLLAVRVGNSLTTLRGVVFTPGHYIPVSAENDIAPNVQMIKRKEIPLPTVNSARAQSHNSQTKENKSLLASLPNVTANPPIKISPASVPKITIPYANPSILSNKQSPPVIQAANSSSGGGNTAPLVIQSANFGNGVLVSNQPSPVVCQMAPPTTSVNQGALSSHPSNASATTNMLTASDSVIESRTDVSHQKMLEGKPNEIGLSHQSAGAQNNMEVNSTISPRMSFQNLLTEVMKRAESPSQGMNPQTELSMAIDKPQEQESGDTHVNEVNLPLQAVESIHHNYSIAVPNSTSSQDNGTDKMSELLRVLQENYDDNRKLEPRRPRTG